MTRLRRWLWRHAWGMVEITGNTGHLTLRRLAVRVFNLLDDQS